MNSFAIKSKEQSKGLSEKIVIYTFLLGIFMGALDHGIVGPALSSIIAAFDVSASWGAWSFTIYTLTFAISIPIFGKLSDRFGRKQTFMTGIILFAIGSIVAAFATNFPLFLLGRAIQAIGSGGIFPITAAQIATTYPPEKRGKALGYVGVAFGIGSILGPTVGGLIIANAAWQWIFLVNVPISIIILLMISGYKQQQKVVKKPIDMKGILLLSLTILAIMYGISSYQSLFIIIGVLLAIVLVFVEKKQQDPVLNVQYFTKKSTIVILLVSLFSGFVMATSINFLPYFTETILGLEKGNSGLFATPFAVFSTISSFIGGYLVDKIGAKKVLMLGFLISLAGAISLAYLVESTIAFVVITAVMGFGVGIIIGAPLNILIMQVIQPTEMGSAIGYLSLFRSMGSTIGPAVGGALIASFTNGFSYLFIVSSVVSVISVILILLFIKNKPKVAS